MGIKMKSRTVTFSDNSVQPVSEEMNFRVRNAAVVIEGFEARYSDNNDHHLERIKIEIRNVDWQDTKVFFDVELHKSDEGNSHTGKGDVTCQIVAEVDN